MESSFLIVFCILCGFYVRRGYYSRTKAGKLVSKCLPVTLLWVWALWYVKTVPAALKLQLLEALGASVAGDALLVFPRLAPLGIVAFGAAQLLYTALFWSSAAEVSSLEASITAMTVIALSISLGSLFREGALESKGLCVLVSSYFCLLSAMLWTAAVRFFAAPCFATAAGAFGAALFYASDVLIAASAFYTSPFFKDRTLIMILYYGAQLMIVLSMDLAS